MADKVLKRAWAFGKNEYVYSDGSNKSKYAVVLGVSCNDPSKLQTMTLMEARIKACKIAKNKCSKYIRVGIFKEDKYHISGGHYMPKLVEDVSCIDGEFYLLKWESTPKSYRVSPKTGKLLDYSKEYRWM